MPLLATAAALCVTAIAYGAEPTDLYVATNGNDGNPGTEAKPFATLHRARDAIRVLKANGLKAPVHVVIRGGVYHLDKTLMLTPVDGGTECFPITWRAADGERVVIRGGRRVTGWKPCGRGVYKADLKGHGLKGVTFHQLFYRGARGKPTAFAERQTLARFPNFDPKHPRTGGYVYAARKGAKPRDQVIYGKDDIPFERWADISQAEVVSTYYRGWMFAITPILGVDAKTRTITVRRVRGHFIKLNRFFIQNAREALDAPGEWYLDRKQAILYFYPPNGDIANGEVIVPVMDHLIELRGTIPYPHGYLNTAFRGRRDEFPTPNDAPPMNPVEHVVFRNLHFECARQDAIRMTGARRCAVIRCRITNVGNMGVNLGGVTTSFAEVGNPRVTPAKGHLAGAGGGGQIMLFNDPCQECRVLGCDVWSAGCEGIMLFGTANVAENNHVYDIGLYAKDCPCINLLGEANVARRNTVHDCPRCAIFIKGVDNVVELNDVHHAVLETTDMGAIRMVQRNLNLKGNVIRFNKVFDTVGYGFKWSQGTHYQSPFYSFGIYLDDYTCGTAIYGNIVARTGRSGVMIHGGGDNLVANNVVVDAGDYQIEFAPIGGSVRGGRRRNEMWKNAFRDNRVEGNVLVCTKKEAVPYRARRDLWGGHDASFANNLVWTGGHPTVVVLTGETGVTWKSWLARGRDRGSTLGDPLFVNAARDDYRLRPESPAWRLGFKRIPVDKIGCYASPERATWPIQPNHERFREEPILHTAPDYDPSSQRTREIAILGPVKEDFEADPVGRPPVRGDVMAPKPSAIVVTDELAATGKQCLKFTDAPGLRHSWQPRVYYPLDFRSGTVAFSADIRLDGRQPPQLYVDARQYSDTGRIEYFSGPMLRVEPNGNLLAGKQTLTKLPFDRWLRIEWRARLGEGAPGHSDLTVTVRGQTPRRFRVRHVSAQFKRLERVVISSLSTDETVFYIDNLAVGPADE